MRSRSYRIEEIGATELWKRFFGSDPSPLSRVVFEIGEIMFIDRGSLCFSFDDDIALALVRVAIEKLTAKIVQEDERPERALFTEGG